VGTVVSPTGTSPRGLTLRRPRRQQHTLSWLPSGDVGYAGMTLAAASATTTHITYMYNVCTM